MKNLIIKAALFLLIFSYGLSTFSFTDNVKEIDNLNFIIDFEYEEFSQKPVISDGRILLPMREFFESIGASIEWDDSNKEINAFSEKNKIILTIGSSDSIVNGVYKEMDVAPILINNTTYIPLRFASEALGYKIIWNEEFKTIYAFSNYEEVDLSDLEDAVQKNDYGHTDLQVVDTFSGIGSWYGGKFHGRRTSSGEVFDQYALTGAHRTLPFGTLVRVTLISSDKSVIIRINDRGPHIASRVIDLSMEAAEIIGLRSRGLGQVYVEVLGN